MGEKGIESLQNLLVSGRRALYSVERQQEDFHPDGQMPAHGYRAIGSIAVDVHEACLGELLAQRLHDRGGGAAALDGHPLAQALAEETEQRTELIADAAPWPGWNLGVEHVEE